MFIFDALCEQSSPHVPAYVDRDDARRGGRRPRFDCVDALVLHRQKFTRATYRATICMEFGGAQGTVSEILSMARSHCPRGCWSGTHLESVTRRTTKRGSSSRRLSTWF